MTRLSDSGAVCLSRLHWAAGILIALLNCHGVLGHPQCLDFQPPFVAKTPLEFCPEYSDFGCCTNEKDAQLKSSHNGILARLAANVVDDCAKDLRQVLCLTCSPFAAHIFDVESKYTSQKLFPMPSPPGLCRSFCEDFFQKCQSIIKHVPTIPAQVSNASSAGRFCDKLTISDPDYCYPRVLNDADRTSELVTGRTSTEGCLCVKLFAEGLRNPLALASPNDLTGRIMVAEQLGLVYIYQKNGHRLPFPFLNLTAQTLTSNRRGDERGFLGLAFHPEFQKNRTVYVYYSVVSSGTQNIRISEFRISVYNGDMVDPSSERVLLEVRQPYANHNGGAILFGTDGFLYAFLGDGGAAGDPRGNGQNKKTLLGSVLRIDVNGNSGNKAYGIPADNPFINQPDIPDEVYAYGVRNMWRCDVDEGDPTNGGKNKGRIICGDVGQSAFEEIDIILKGKNYGWNVKEGLACYSRSPCDDDDFEDPIWAYPHSVGKSVTGGHTYRGCRSPRLNGQYIYGDFTNGKLFSLQENSIGAWRNKDLHMCGPDLCTQGLVSSYEPNILSFGEDDDGEIYMLTTQDARVQEALGKVYMIVDPRKRGDPATCRSEIRRKHAQTTTQSVNTGSTRNPFGTGTPGGSTRKPYGTGTPGGTGPNGGSTGPPGPETSGGRGFYQRMRTFVIPVTTCILVPVVSCITQFV